jgi:hypothetical protein
MPGRLKTESTMKATDMDPQAAVCRLIALISPDAETAQEMLAAFQAADPDASDAGAETEGAALMWSLKEVGDWKIVFYVDWKDTESFVQSIDALCALRGIELDWGCDDPLADGFLDGRAVPDLIPIAHEGLAPHGLGLWSWDTQGDCYSGFITHRADEAAVRSISRSVGVEFRAGDEDSF